MRSATILIAVFLLVGAAVLTYLPSVTSASKGEGPGSYPIGSSRFQWPAKTRRAAFHPMKGTGTDELPPSSSVDAKTQCLRDCPVISPSNRADAFL